MSCKENKAARIYKAASIEKARVMELDSKSCNTTFQLLVVTRVLFGNVEAGPLRRLSFADSQ